MAVWRSERAVWGQYGGMGSVCKNGFLRACEIQFSESRQEGVSHLNIALFSSVMRRGSSFEGLVWLSALFFVQRDARQSRSFIVEWRGMPSLFRSASAFGASIPEPTLTRRGGTTWPNSLCETRVSRS